MQDTSTVRVTRETRDSLRRLAESEGRTIQDLVTELARRAEDERMLAEHNAIYARLRHDPEAWAEDQAERAVWEATLADGLEGLQ